MFRLNSTVDISKVIHDENYRNDLGINLKAYENSYMLNYDKSKLTSENIDTLGNFRSVITNGEKIVCYSPGKAYGVVDFSKQNKLEDIVLEEFVEGTMINVYYENDEWKCATRGNIGAKCKFFRDYNKTYRTLFLEVMESSGLEFEMLNKSYMYSFIIQHPENRIVIPFSEKKLYLIAMYKADGFNVEKVEMTTNPFSIQLEELNIHTPKLVEKKFNSYSELLDYYTSYNIDYKSVGIVLKCGQMRAKLWNPNYLKVKTLRGNNPKIQYQYYNLLRDRKLGEFLHYYPEYRELFDNYKNDLYNWTEQLWKNYKSCYIRKENPLKMYPGVFRTHMFNIHQNYLSILKLDHKRVDKLAVIKYVNSLEPAQIMYGINYVYRDVKKDEEEAKLKTESMI